MSSRWREENYFRYARAHFALDALDSYAAAPDDPDRLVPSPAKKAAAARVRPAEGRRRRGRSRPGRQPARAAQPRPRPRRAGHQPAGHKLNAPVRPPMASWTRPRQPPRPSPPGSGSASLAPDMVQLDTETKLITHAIRMAAYNAETILARALDGHYARAGDEAYALIREALATCGDITPAPASCTSGWTRSPPPGAPRRWPPSATSSTRPEPLSRHRPRPALRGQAPPRPCMNFCAMSRVLDLGAGERLRTANLPFTSSAASRAERANCTDGTDNCADGTRCAGIIPCVVPPNRSTRTEGKVNGRSRA